MLPMRRFSERSKQPLQHAHSRTAVRVSRKETVLHAQIQYEQTGTEKFAHALLLILMREVYLQRSMMFGV